MDVTLESVGDVSRRKRLLQKWGLRPRLTITLEFYEARDLETAIDMADTYATPASVNSVLNELQGKIAGTLNGWLAAHKGEDS